MSGVGGGPGRAVAGVAAAQARAADQAAAEVVRLNRGLQPAVSALWAIGDSARSQSRYSARARVLELEVLPAGPYLGQCVDLLRDDLVTRHAARRSPSQVTARVDEIQTLLERVLEVTATVDIPGELGLPLELVSTVQSGAVAGLAHLARLREILDAPEIAHQHTEVGQADQRQPSPSAHWLVHTASRLLPPGSRDRYAEEFASELRALADAQHSRRAQLGHALRQLTTIWALRRALPAAPPRPADPSATPAPTGPDRVRVPPGAGHTTGVRTRLLDYLREPVDRWLTRRQARRIIREQAQTQYESNVTSPFPTRARGRHRR